MRTYVFKYKTNIQESSQADPHVMVHRLWTEASFARLRFSKEIHFSILLIHTAIPLWSFMAVPEVAHPCTLNTFIVKSILLILLLQGLTIRILLQ